MKGGFGFILFIALAGSVFFNWQLTQKEKLAQAKILEQAEQIDKLKARLDRASNRFQSDADAERLVIEQLKQQLKIEQDNLASLDFDRNRAHNGGVGGDDPSGYNDPIRNEESTIQELQNQMAQLNSQGSALANSQKQAIGQTKLEESQASQQITAAIQAGKQNLESLQAQRKALQPRIFDYGVNAQVQGLTQQINEQQTQIQGLRQQRQAYDQQGKYAEHSIQNQTGSQLNDVNQSRAQLKQRLQAEQAALSNLKQKQKAASQSRNTQKSAISQIDRTYQAEKQKIDQLQSQIKTEEARLQSLTL